MKDFVIKLVPQKVRGYIRKKVPLLDHDLKRWAENDHVSNLPPITKKESRYPIKFGIIKDYAHYHRFYVAACRELKVAYELVDISQNNWIDEFLNCGCDVFLVWPSVNLTVWKEMFDERLRILVNVLKKEIFPSYEEIWLYENKRRVREWLTAHKIPHPRTWIFYNLDEALGFLERAEYPIVRKTALGAASHGIKILKNRREAAKDVIKAIKKGIVPERFDPRDKQWGYVILQEYVPHQFEWRVVRIGDDFMVRKKIKRGSFASGSGTVLWARPSEGLLDFAYKVTEVGNFKSIAIDLFEVEGKFLVNELQALFGDIEKKNRFKGESIGKYNFDKERGKWIFHAGYFYTNACANLRVEYLIKKKLG